MSEKLTDLFCEAGGSGQGAAHVPGLDLGRATAPCPRVGPGDRSRALPAPTRTGTSAIPRAAVEAGRAPHTTATGATP
ncbi:MAG: hypothetical protein ACRDRK_16190 [Pseudonocardia sp.]